MSLQDIPLKLLDPSPYQMRSMIDPNGLNELTASMKRGGQQQPIKVRKVGDRYEVIYGHRRISAANRDNWETIQALVVEMGDEEVLWAQWDENEYHENISDYDQARWLKGMIDQGYTQIELAEKIGKTQAWISYHRAIMRLEGIITRVILSKLTEYQARPILKVEEKYWSKIDEELVIYHDEHGELPSSSFIKDIIQHAQNEEHDEELAKTDEEQPRETMEEYIADYRAKHAAPDTEFLAWSLSEKYGLPERESRKLARGRPAYTGEPREAAVPTKPSRYEPPQSPTCRCPLCGRDSADKTLIISNFVEDKEMAQKTLHDFITEALRK